MFDFANDLLLSDAARARGLFEPKAIEGLLGRHRAGEDHGERLWNLCVLETWYREMVDGRATFMRGVADKARALSQK